MWQDILFFHEVNLLGQEHGEVRDDLVGSAEKTSKQMGAR